MIHDHQRVLQVARVVSLNKLLPPLQTELISIREVLIWCMNTGFNRGNVETNSKIAASLVLFNSPYLGLCFLAQDIRSILKAQPHLSVSFAFREGNCVAHALTNFTTSIDITVMWFHMGPRWLMFLILKDVSSVV